MRTLRSPLAVGFLAVASAVAFVTVATAENVDPAGDGSQYVWSENAGWINAEPSGDGGPGMRVDDFAVTGWMWGENTGWISLSCENTATCDTTRYGVRNDGEGTLTGQAWSENLGWIRFDPSAGGGVRVDAATGEMSGEAWSENTGWLVFRDDGVNPFRVRTGWTCDPAPAPPSGVPVLEVARAGSDVRLDWSAPSGATGYDVVSGKLEVLRAGGGDFGSTSGCLLDNDAGPSVVLPSEATDPTATWYLVRALNCGGAGSYDSGGSRQAAPRDAGIAGSGAACP